MGVSVKEEFTEEWKTISGLVEGVEYSLQNVNTADLFLRDVLIQPGKNEIGNRLTPSMFAVIKQEAGSLVWGRSKTTIGLAFYNSID